MATKRNLRSRNKRRVTKKRLVHRRTKKVFKKNGSKRVFQRGGNFNPEQTEKLKAAIDQMKFRDGTQPTDEEKAAYLAQLQRNSQMDSNIFLFNLLLSSINAFDNRPRFIQNMDNIANLEENNATDVYDSDESSNASEYGT